MRQGYICRRSLPPSFDMTLIYPLTFYDMRDESGARNELLANEPMRVAS